MNTLRLDTLSSSSLPSSSLAELYETTSVMRQLYPERGGRRRDGESRRYTNSSLQHDGLAPSGQEMIGTFLAFDMSFGRAHHHKFAATSKADAKNPTAYTTANNQSIEEREGGFLMIFLNFFFSGSFWRCSRSRLIAGIQDGPRTGLRQDSMGYRRHTM